MGTPVKSSPAYIASVIREHSDRYLHEHSFCRGMVIFAVPDYGVLFKCQAEGRKIDLEFGAFFSLLRFVEKSMAGEKIGKLCVYSSLPEFVFAFSGQSRHLAPDSERMRLLKERTVKLGASVSYIEPSRNLALCSPADYPAVPKGKKVVVLSTLSDDTRKLFRPIQKGIRI